VQRRWRRLDQLPGALESGARSNRRGQPDSVVCRSRRAPSAGDTLTLTFDARDGLHPPTHPDPVRKAARYVRLYGPRRTAVKIRSQYHMRSLAGPPAAPRSGPFGCSRRPDRMRQLCVQRHRFYLRKNVGSVIRGRWMWSPRGAASLARDYRAHYSTTDAARVIQDPAIDLVYVASITLHADYAIALSRLARACTSRSPCGG